MVGDIFDISFSIPLLLCSKNLVIIVFNKVPNGKNKDYTSILVNTKLNIYDKLDEDSFTKIIFSKV